LRKPYVPRLVCPRGMNRWRVSRWRMKLEAKGKTRCPTVLWLVTSGNLATN